MVDSQKYGSENFGTCLLIGPDEIRKEKERALFAFEILETEYFAEEFSQVSKRLGIEVQFARVTLNAVHNIETRREIQRELWSDLIIDDTIDIWDSDVHPETIPLHWGSLQALLRSVELFESIARVF